MRSTSLLAVWLSTCLLLGCSWPSTVRDRVRAPSLEQHVATAHAAAPGPEDPYLAPSRDEASTVAAAVAEARSGRIVEARRTAEQVGYDVERTRVGGRILLTVLEDEDHRDRGWGMYVVAVESGAATATTTPRASDDGITAAASVPAGLVLEVPHARFEFDTDRLGLRLLDAAEADVLLLSTAHRRAGDGTADVARSPAVSVFAAVHEQVVGRGSVVVQLHGFAPSERPGLGADAIVSSGTSEPSAVATRLVEQFATPSRPVCLYGRDCDVLGGTGNVLAGPTRAAGAEFLHVELAPALRIDQRSRTTTDLAAALRG